jgi:hypothetical protein
MVSPNMVQFRLRYVSFVNDPRGEKSSISKFSDKSKRVNSVNDFREVISLILFLDKSKPVTLDGIILLSIIDVSFSSVISFSLNSRITLIPFSLVNFPILK